MNISKERLEFIKKHFFEFSFNEDESDEEQIPDFEAFKSLTSAEQYLLANEYNWDDGVIVLDWIIDSPLCDKGTATLIFWLAEPDYHFDHSEETINDSAMAEWKLLQKIILKMNNDEFDKSEFEFIPSENGYQTEWSSATGIWKLPQTLISGTKGTKLTFTVN